jgi:hypothetical protein
MDEILEIKSQKLSLLLADFQICRACRVVDRDWERLRVGHPCGVCGKPSEAGLMYFHISIHILINLMQEAFHSPPVIHDGETDVAIETDAHNISVLLFFSTLREMLMNNFITHICSASKIPVGVYNRLLSDNRTYMQRQEKLLPSLTGKKWEQLIKEENEKVEIDFKSMNVFLVKSMEKRNRFMHEGAKWGIDRGIAEGCIINIWPLLNFYVCIHNRFVHSVDMK